MLLILDPSLLNGIQHNQNVIHALDLIAHSRRLGYHIVLGDREVIKYLATCDSLSKLAQEVYKDIYNNLPIIHSYRHVMRTQVKVVLENILEFVEIDGFHFILVCIEYFSSYLSIHSPTILLAENLDDVSFYKRVADTYIKSNTLGNIHIRCESRHGGGGTTTQVFQQIQSGEQNFCLCILDSDKKAPKLSPGNTARDVSRAHNPKQHLCKVYILNVREIENLIPTSIYRDLFIEDQNKKNAIDFIEFIDNNHIDIRNYLDLKNGLKLCKVFKENREGEFFKYWINCARIISETFNQNLYICLQNLVCSKTEDKDCECYVTFGFGDNIIRKIEDKKYSSSDFHLAISSCVFLKEELESLGATITFWCCALPSIPTIPAQN